jgi:hypothetical protein
VRASDLFEPASLKALAAKVDAKLQADVRQLRRQHVDGIVENRIFGLEDLDHFTIGDGGLTFLYDFGFPHVIEALEPSGEYFFSWAELAGFLRPNRQGIKP